MTDKTINLNPTFSVHDFIHEFQKFDDKFYETFLYIC